jgi:hypothetical protein
MKKRQELSISKPEGKRPSENLDVKDITILK